MDAEDIKDTYGEEEEYDSQEEQDGLIEDIDVIDDEVDEEGAEGKCRADAI
jgi:hypothetical protein